MNRRWWQHPLVSIGIKVNLGIPEIYLGAAGRPPGCGSSWPGADPGCEAVFRLHVVAYNLIRLAKLLGSLEMMI